MIRNPFFPRLTWATNQPIGPINEKRGFGDKPKSLYFTMAPKGDSNPHGFPRHPLKMPLSDCD